MARVLHWYFHLKVLIMVRRGLSLAEIIPDMAKAIAAKYRSPARWSEVLAILQREHAWQEASPELHLETMPIKRALSVLEDAFESAPFSTVVRVFQEAELDLLHSRIDNWDFLCTRMVPFMTLDELETATRDYLKHLEYYEPSFLADGEVPEHPEARRHPLNDSGWLFSGDRPFKIMPRKHWREMGEEENRIAIEKRRRILASCRAVLQNMINHLHVRQSATLLSSCWGDLASRLDPGDVRPRGRSFIGPAIWDRHAGIPFTPHVQTLFIAIGHCEEELLVGLIDRTKRGLLAAGGDSYEQDLVPLLRSRMPSAYFVIADTPYAKAVDAVLDAQNDLRKLADNFWMGYGELVDKKVGAYAEESVQKKIGQAQKDEEPAHIEDGRKRFPTPPSATWGQVDITFKNGDEVIIKVGEVSGEYDYADMAMRDGRDGGTDVQWKLLRELADGNGELRRPDRLDRPVARDQKRREILAKNLRDFFCIEEDPFETAEDGKSWCTRFTIHPD